MAWTVYDVEHSACVVKIRTTTERARKQSEEDVTADDKIEKAAEGKDDDKDDDTAS